MVSLRFERERRVSTVKSNFLLVTLSRKSDVEYEERYFLHPFFRHTSRYNLFIGNLFERKYGSSKPDPRATFLDKTLPPSPRCLGLLDREFETRNAKACGTNGGNRG